MRQDISAHEYETLYTKYLRSRGPEELLKLAGDLKDKTIVDLCCGNGRLGIKAIEMGAKRVIFVDANSSMTSAVSKKLVTVDEWTVMATTVGEALASMKPSSIDHVFCQQAINYWFNKMDIKYLARALKPGGHFVFNTFLEKPSVVPQFRSYTIEGRHYAEVYYLIPPNIVTHIQMREGWHPHHAIFRWISTDAFIDVLSGPFDLAVLDHKSTQIYNCVKRDK